jgi:hypothetical protein
MARAKVARRAARQRAEREAWLFRPRSIRYTPRQPWWRRLVTFIRGLFRRENQ